MTVKKAPWLPEFMAEMDLQERAPGLWINGSRSIYLGEATVVITSLGGSPEEFTSQHRYPEFPDISWMFDAVCDHLIQMSAERVVDPELTESVRELRSEAQAAGAGAILPKDPGTLN